MTRQTRNPWKVLGMILLLSGCGGLGSASRQAHLYDLGLGQRVGPESGLVGAVQVLAPSWLRSGAMQYRLSYEFVSERHNYLESRWAAPPAELVQGVLGRALGGTGGCKLELELDEFIQDYSAVSNSDVVMEARAHLRAAQDGAVLASRAFSLRLPAASPDAPGGVAALVRGTRQLAAELGAWLGELGQDTKLKEACIRR